MELNKRIKHTNGKAVMAAMPETEISLFLIAAIGFKLSNLKLGICNY